MCESCGEDTTSDKDAWQTVNKQYDKKKPEKGFFLVQNKMATSSLCAHKSTWVDEGRKCGALLVMKTRACTVVGRRGECPLCDPESELGKGESWRSRARDHRLDGKLNRSKKNTRKIPKQIQCFLVAAG